MTARSSARASARRSRASAGRFIRQRLRNSLVTALAIWIALPIALIGTLATSARTAQAAPGDQPTWQCTPQGILFQNPQAVPPAHVYGVDLVSGKTSDPSGKTSNPSMSISGWVINSVGYNTLDNYIYGWGHFKTGPVAGTLVRVGSDGSVESLDVSNGAFSAPALFVKLLVSR